MEGIDTEWFYKLCGLALLFAVISVLMNELTPGMRKPIRALGTILLYGGVLLVLGTLLKSCRDVFSSIFSQSYSKVMLKCLGIALLAEIASDICRDLGESGVSNTIELGAKLLILLLGLPTVGEILSFAVQWL